MIKPNMPGIGTMNDTLDFVKNLWGGAMGGAKPGMPGMTMPGMVMPTLSVEEINKKIADLRAVESWLTLNMNMLRGTIQSLEVQAATISTLQTMGESFAASMKGTERDKPAAASAFSTASAAGRTDGTSNMGAPSAPDDGKPAATTAETSPPPEQTRADAASLAAPLVNAAAWWGMLQDQFKQAVGNAMTPEAAPSTVKPSPDTTKPKARANPAPATKPAPSKTAAPKRKPAK